MTNIWIHETLNQVHQYRSAYQRELQIDRFGSDQPVAFVTGSASARVGNYVARNFLCHGYRVVFHAHQSVDRGLQQIAACEDAGLDAMLVTGDIQCEATVAGWASQIQSRFGRLDAVVHCAASWERKALEETTAADVQLNLSNHVVGSFLVAKHAGLLMAKQATGGSIVLTGDWAVTRPYPDFAGYFAGKGSVPTLTRSMAVELAARNAKVRVNAILPGIVLLGSHRSEAELAQLEAAALVRRLGTPQDIAQAALFLTEASFVTGECLHVDGGRHCYAGPSVDELAHPEYRPPVDESV